MPSPLNTQRSHTSSSNTSPKHNKIYHRTDEKILQAAYALARRPHSVTGLTVRRLCRRAKISISTFYRHFHNLFAFTHRQEKQFLKEFSALTRSIPPTANSSQTFEKVLIFIYQHRKIVRLKLTTRDYAIFEELFRHLRPRLTKTWTNYGASANDLIYQIFTFSGIALINLWYRQSKFSVNQIPILAQQLTLLSRTSPTFLAPLAKIC